MEAKVNQKVKDAFCVGLAKVEQHFKEVMNFIVW